MSAHKPTADPTISVTYIRGNFEPSDCLAVVVLNKGTNAVTQRIGTAQTIMEPDFQSWLSDRNERDHSEIYISMNALHPHAKGRTKHDIAAIRHIYLDFDVDGTAAVERLVKRRDLPTPNYLINTSADKWQVVWKVDGFGKEPAEALQRGLARETGADIAATDISRVLRLPGFLNHKYAPPYLIQMQVLSYEAYGPSRFPVTPVQDHLDGVVGRRSPARRCGDLSQSEKDWSFAKRALARGDPPERVIAAIASFRRYDKSGPERYAELTVRKAQDALRTEAAQFEGPERT